MSHKKNFYIVPAWTDQSGQCRIVSRETAQKIDAEASYRESPKLWAEAGLMNSRGKLVCLNDKEAFDEMAQDEPLMAGMQYTFDAAPEDLESPRRNMHESPRG